METVPMNILRYLASEDVSRTDYENLPRTNADILQEEADLDLGLNMLDLEELRELENQAELEINISEISSNSAERFFDATTLTGTAQAAVLAQADLLAMQVANHTNRPVHEIVPHVLASDRPEIVGESGTFIYNHSPYQQIKTNPGTLKLAGESLKDIGKEYAKRGFDKIVELYERFSQLIYKYFGKTKKLLGHLKKMKEQSGRLEGIKPRNSILNVSGKEANTMTYVNISNGTPVYIKSGREIKNFLEVLSEIKTASLETAVYNLKTNLEKTEEAYETLRSSDKTAIVEVLNKTRERMFETFESSLVHSSNTSAEYTAKLTQSKQNAQLPILPLPGFRVLVISVPSGFTPVGNAYVLMHNGNPVNHARETNLDNDGIVATLNNTDNFKIYTTPADPTSRTTIKSSFEFKVIKPADLEEILSKLIDLTEDIYNARISKVYLDGTRAVRRFTKFTEKKEEEINRGQTAEHDVIEKRYKALTKFILKNGLTCYKMNMEILRNLELGIEVIANICSRSLAEYR